MALKNWPLNTVTANVETDLVVPAANKEVAIVSIFIYAGGSGGGATSIKLRSSGGTALATLWSGTLAGGESIQIDSKIFLAASATPDKICVTAELGNTSFCASGVEKAPE